jgi:hypothetical protein
MSADRTGPARHRLLRGEKVVGFVKIASHQQGDNRQQRADDERNPPSPGPQLFRRQKHLLEQQQHQDRAQLAADQRHVLEA